MPAQCGVELGLGPLVVKGCILTWLWRQKLFRLPVYSWVGLCSYPIGYLAWGLPVLESIGSWVRPHHGTKWEHTDKYSLVQLSPVSLSLQWATAIYTSSGDPPEVSGFSGPNSYVITAFALGPDVHDILYMPCRSGMSVYPSSVEHLSPTGLQNQMFWSRLLWMTDSQVEKPDIELKTLTPCLIISNMCTFYHLLIFFFICL